MSLHGSIGYDSAITAAGEVWANEYDLGGPDAFKGNWHLTAGKERIGYLVIGARYHPELGRLLPKRPTDAPRCSECEGSGEKTFRAPDGSKVAPFPGMICDACAGLGWVSSREDR